MKRYLIVFVRAHNNPALGDFALIGSADTLEECKSIRNVSGDIVICAKTKQVISDQAWLWDWEKDAINCFARKMIALYGN